ncbi:RAD54L2 [Cordylochernes scorpioides]|uniref:RAD54L2 n=1 Tax=Cordylochernes scorpioides TaxID=51811 RepID=A0ABY6KTC2_9ARAC|nr:RAD54L2 [Cordylochernes scorpioides]
MVQAMIILVGRSRRLLFTIWNHPDILYDLLQNQRQIAQGEDLDLDLATATKRGAAAARAKKDGVKNGFIPDTTMSPYRDKNDPSINYDWDYIPGQVSNSYKMTIMFAILEQTLAVGDKILVFSQSLFTLSLIEKILSQREVPYRPGPPEKWARNKNYYRLDGSTNAQDREKMIQDFNGNANVVLFLLSTRAGCLGINLIGANRIIVLDASWNPCHDAQAVCRIYRYGQQKPCFIYRLITDNSLEKRIYDRQINKQGMSDRVVDELTPECNFTMKEVNTLTHENEEDNPVRDYSDMVEAFNDHILKHIYTHFNYCLSKDLKLTKQEKRMAKKSYEMEKRANMHNYRGGGHSNFNAISNISPNLIRPWLGSAGFSLLPNNSAGSTDKPAGGMLNNLLKPGCSVQKIKVPQDVTIPVTTPGLPPVHIKSGQEVIVMKTPKGMCLQLPGGRLVAIHFNPATLGDKQGADKGKPILPMKNRIVQPNLQCGGMVSMRGGTAVKRPTEVINLSDDNDSDTEVTAPKKLAAPPKPSISITPVSNQPKLAKKPAEASGAGEKKWPSSLSNLNLPSNLSVSILPVNSKSSTATTSSQPTKLIKLNTGERSTPLAGLPSGIDVSILPQQQRPSKVTKIILPTSTAASMLAEKAAAASASSSSSSPIANIPSGVSILPFSKSSQGGATGKPNISVLPAKGKPSEQQPSFPPNLNVSIVPTSSPLPPSITLTPSNKEDPKPDEPTVPESNSPETSQNASNPPNTEDPTPAIEKPSEQPTSSEEIAKPADKPQSSPPPTEEIPASVSSPEKLQRADEEKQLQEANVAEEQESLSNPEQTSPIPSEIPASAALPQTETSESQDKEPQTTSPQQSIQHPELEQPNTTPPKPSPPKNTETTTPISSSPTYQNISQAESSQSNYQQNYLSTMSTTNSFFQETEPQQLPFNLPSVTSANPDPGEAAQHNNQPLPSTSDCTTPQKSAHNLPMHSELPHSTVGFQMPHQTMKPPPYHQVTLPPTYASQPDQSSPPKHYQPQEKLQPYQKPRKPYTKKKAAERPSTHVQQLPYGSGNQLFNPLSWQNAPMEENKGYSGMTPQQSNIYNQKSYDNTSWGTAYQMPPADKPANKAGENFPTWPQHTANTPRQNDANQMEHFQRGPSKGEQLPNLSSPPGYDWPASSSTASLVSNNPVTNTWAGNDTMEKSNEFNAWNSTAMKKTTDPKTQQQQGWFDGMSPPQQKQQQQQPSTGSSSSEWNSPVTSYLNLDGNTNKSGGNNPTSQSSAEWFHSDSADMAFQQTGNWQVRGFIPNVDCGIRRSYLGPKQRLSEGREDVNDEERAGRSSTSTTDEKINEVEKMILANRRITVREVAEDLNISIGSCHSIFINDLGMRRVAAKFVPKLLNCDQKQHRMNIANEMLDSVRDDPNLLQRVITGDEAWVYGYDVETKAQSSQWKLPHEPRPKKVRQVRSNVEVLLTVFFDFRGVVHHEFLPQGRTVNKEYYLQVMRNLREAIRQKRPDLWKNKNWLLHHDNAPAHTSLLVRDLLAKNNTLMMPQPPYSPDMAPCDFFLFPKLKRPMKG